MFKKKENRNVNLISPELTEFVREFKEFVNEEKRFRQAVKEHDSILGSMLGIQISSLGWNSALKINGVELEMDYREKELYNKEKMVKVLFIGKNGNTSTKYTKEKNLNKHETEYFKKNSFVLIDENKNA